MNNITQPLLLGQQLRAAKLNDAIRAVATKPWNGRHDFVTVVVDFDPVDDAAIRAAIAAHLTTDWAAQEASEAARLAAIDATVSGFVFGGATLAQLKAMDNAAFDNWWAANVTTLAQANTVLKLLARTMLRRVL